jgi:hypothetical protein
MNDSAGSTLTVSEKKGDEISDENSEESENKQIEEEEPSLVGSKSSKRRKVKKEKPFKDIHVPSMPKSEAGTKEESAGDAGDGNSVAPDPEEVLRWLATLKKKKSMKDADAAAKAGASETATRATRLAAAKKREKPHYNQQPLR